MPDHWIALDGAVNARDLGGLPLAGGGATAPGVLLRADNLQGLSAADVTRLVDELELRVVVDLRTGAEVRREGPGPLVLDGRVDVRHRSLFPEAGESTDIAVDALLPWRSTADERDAGEPAAVRAYLGYLRDRPDSIVAALRDVAGGEGATIVHCAAGKDRTGVVCALALAAVGVEREAIVGDFVATGERIEAILRRLRASPTYARDLGDGPVDRHVPWPQTMRRLLALLDERHGGAQGWLGEHGFGGDDVSALRARLTA
jgi:protein-tyrosine phosphatase